jgi:hypothetical protein
MVFVNGFGKLVNNKWSKEPLAYDFKRISGQ